MHPWVSSDVLVQFIFNADPGPRGLKENRNEVGLRYWTFPPDYPERIIGILRDGAAATPEDVIAESGDSQIQTTSQTYAYACNDGFNFTARIEGEKAWLFLPNQTVSLPLVSTDSGTTYKEGAIMFHSESDEALLELDNVRFYCHNNRPKAIWEDAKFRGVSFRTLGNEPGWKLELTLSEKAVFVGDYGNTRHEFTALKAAVDEDARTTTYYAKDSEHECTIVIEGRPCSDTMSGEVFEAVVTVTLDDKEYRGCGRPLF